MDLVTKPSNWDPSRARDVIDSGFDNTVSAAEWWFRTSKVQYR